MRTPDLIDTLANSATPVRRLRPPVVRAALWLLMAAAVLLLLAIAHGVRPDLSTKMHQQIFVAGMVFALATAILAAIAAFKLSLVDNSRWWALLPAPALALWVSTIGYGCLTDWVNFDSGTMRVGEALRCFATLLLVSLPLSASMFVMLRHAARLRPSMVTMTAGLAVAAITSTAMSLLHRLDATIMILMWNLGTAMVIVLIEGAAGKRILAWLDRTPAR